MRSGIVGCILITAFMLSCPVVAADLKGGFRDLRWGDPVSIDMEKIHASEIETNMGIHKYKRQKDKLFLGDIPLCSIDYGFVGGALLSVEMRFNPINYQRMLLALNEAWGPGHKGEMSSLSWFDSTNNTSASLHAHPEHYVLLNDASRAKEILENMDNAIRKMNEDLKDSLKKAKDDL